MTEPLLSQGYHISPGDTQCTLTIDDKLLGTLQTTGKGFPTSGRTLRAVNLLLSPPADSPSEGILQPTVSPSHTNSYEACPFIRVENGKKVFRRK